MESYCLKCRIYTKNINPQDIKKCIKTESYCLKCRIFTKNINPQVFSTNNGKLMILSRCEFIKK